MQEDSKIVSKNGQKNGLKRASNVQLFPILSTTPERAFLSSDRRWKRTGRGRDYSGAAASNESSAKVREGSAVGRVCVAPSSNMMSYLKDISLRSSRGWNSLFVAISRVC